MVGMLTRYFQFALLETSICIDSNYVFFLEYRLIELLQILKHLLVSVFAYI